MTPPERLLALAARADALAAEFRSLAAEARSLAAGIDARDPKSRDAWVLGLKAAAWVSGESEDSLRGAMRRGSIRSEWRAEALGGRRAFRRADLLARRADREEIERGAKPADPGRPIAAASGDGA